MQVLPPGVLPPNFQSPHVRAGHYTLEGLDTDVRGLIAQLLAGGVETRTAHWNFLPHRAGITPSFLPLHPDGLMSSDARKRFTITGGETKNIRQPEIDWEVKAASRPYDNLQELANEWSLGLTSRPPQVEIVATPIAAIDAQNSKVSGDKAIIQVRSARGLEQDRIKVGYRLYAPGKITTRDVLQGGSMTWSEEENVIRGEATIQVPLAAALNCTVSYDGIAQSHRLVVRPSPSSKSSTCCLRNLRCKT